MLDPITLLLAGAAISASTLVREATKDGYNFAKTKVAELFGRPATDALTTLEQQPADAAARNALTVMLEQATPEQRAALQPHIDLLRHALADDPEARNLARDRGHINLVLNIEGDIELARIEGASVIDVRANAGGNFSLTDITMARSSSRGN